MFEIKNKNTGCLRKVRRINNLYISGCIGDGAPNEVPSESLFKDILFEWESSARGHCTGERKSILVMSSFTGAAKTSTATRPTSTWIAKLTVKTSDFGHMGSQM